MGTANSCLSNTFHTSYSQETFNKNAIDINRASEDEFLLLPGITRQLAINIIQYRISNDGFKQINDILKINGMTSNIFKHIYNDITISSHNQQKFINLNFASYNELCSIPCLTPNLVKRIIQRRERKGSFRFIEDLLKIKGIDYIILATIYPYVTINQPKISTSISNYSMNNPLLNHTDTLSLASILLETLPSELQTILISSPPHRPLIMRNNYKQKIFRFASWNLQQLTNEKIQNPGVKEIICRIILENNFSLIGIQEIGNKESLNVIIQELNNPTIPSIKNCSNHQQNKWNFLINDIVDESEYLGFIYNESNDIELKQILILSHNANFSRSPFIILFRIYKKFEFIFINIHLESQRLDEIKALLVLVQAMKNTIEQKHIVIFGDFNMIPTASEFEGLINYNYSYMIQQNTDIDLKNLEGTICVDNIWLSSEAKALSTENSGVIRDNLSSMWIPTGWTWGGLVSNHCPIWIEFDFS